jgi:Iron-sulphur cluster biosynthesis
MDVWRAGDTTVQRDGVSVFIDSASLPYLAGAQLDYCDDLVGTGFRLHNPNAVRSCGCGTSFEPSLAAGTAKGLVGATNLGALGGEAGVVMEGAG